MADNSLPKCKAPNCPDRDKMILVDETPSHWVFACLACKDAFRTISSQIRSKPIGRALAIEKVKIDRMKKAQEVKKRLGKITYFR